MTKSLSTSCLLLVLLYVAIICLVTTWQPTADAFGVVELLPLSRRPPLLSTLNRRCLDVRTTTKTTRLFLSKSDGSDSKRKRRVRRKSEESTESDENASTSTSPSSTGSNNNNSPEPSSNTAEVLKPRDETRVAMKVTDVRELVGQKKKPANTNSNSNASNLSSQPATMPSQQSPSSSVAKSTTTTTSSSSSLDDSLERLLADAREMQAAAQNKDDDSNGSTSDSSVTATVRNAISTLVTVDFFVVCAFLVWFLAGVFCSTVLKNDAVQIAFNGIFQALVQPALGILMIAALADAVFKKDDEDDNNSGGGGNN